MFMFLKRLWLKDEVEQYNKLLKYLVKGLDDLLTILKNPQEFLKVDDVYHIKVFILLGDIQALIIRYSNNKFSSPSTIMALTQFEQQSVSLFDNLLSVKTGYEKSIYELGLLKIANPEEVPKSAIGRLMEIRTNYEKEYYKSFASLIHEISRIRMDLRFELIGLITGRDVVKELYDSKKKPKGKPIMIQTYTIQRKEEEKS